MGGGKVNFNQLSFIQKFNYVKNNLNNSQIVKTSDIVNEIVKLSQNNTEINVDDLPEGFKIIKTTSNNVNMNTSGTNTPDLDTIENVYDSPDIRDFPEDVIKFADTLNKLLENISAVPPEFKEIVINVLTEFLNGILFETIENVYDTPDVQPEFLETIENVYDTPDTPPESLETIENVYDTPDVPPDIMETIENVYDAPDIKENFEKTLRGLLPDVTKLSADVKDAIVRLIQAALDKLNQTTGISPTPKANSNNVQIKKTPTEILRKYGNIVKVYNYSGQLLRTEPYDEAKHGTFN